MLLNSVICCLFSGIILALGTPSIGIWQLSLVSFIPLLFAVENQFYRGKVSFFRMFFLGFVFSSIFAFSCFYWITNMNWAAMFAAAAIYALVYSLFAPGIVLASPLRKTAPLLSKQVDPFNAHLFANMFQFSGSNNLGRIFRYDFTESGTHTWTEVGVIYPG